MVLEDPGVLAPLPPRLLRLVPEDRAVLEDREDLVHLAPLSVVVPAGGTECCTDSAGGSFIYKEKASDCVQTESR